MSNKHQILCRINRYKGHLILSRIWALKGIELFPDDLELLFMAYRIELEHRIKERTAYFLEKLVTRFLDRPLMLSEMRKITEDLRSKSKELFLKDVFEVLTYDSRYKILLKVADHCKFASEYCDLITILLQEVVRHGKCHNSGNQIIEKLILARSMKQHLGKGNPFLKLIACEVMPLVLFTSIFKLTTDVFLCLLQEKLECILISVFHSPEESSEINLAWYVHVESKRFAKRVDTNWKSIFHIMKLAANKCDLPSLDLFSSRLHLVISWKHEAIKELLSNRLMSASYPDEFRPYGLFPNEKEVFLSASVIFFYSLYKFFGYISPSLHPKPNSCATDFVLIETLRTNNFQTYPLNKALIHDVRYTRQKDGSVITVSKRASRETSFLISKTFIMCISIWDFIFTHFSFYDHPGHLFSDIKLTDLPCYKDFFISNLIYRGHHQDAINYLTSAYANTKDVLLKNKKGIQLASCLNFTGKFVDACEYLFDSLCLFTSIPEAKKCHIPLSPLSGCHVHFIANTPQETLNFCIELLLGIFKKMLEQHTQNLDFLGHLLILCQYKFPREEKTLYRCIAMIQEIGGLRFDSLFDYIILTVIRTQMTIVTTSAGNLVVINKSYEQEMEETFAKGISISHDNTNQVFHSFIVNERGVIKSILQQIGCS